jgi:uncharacterized repeat protein (TIGR01451 family)
MLTLLVGSAAADDPAAGCTTTTGTTTCVFAYTGARQDWVVPAGVTSAVFDLDGAAGGSFAPIGFLPGGTGGGGGHVHSTVAVTPGQTLYLRVGGEGEDGGAFESSGADELTETSLGGFNGGGTTTITCSFCGFTLGAAGGGASDVRSSADGLANRLLVAGGGGGGGTGGVGIEIPSEPGDGGDSATGASSLSSDFEFGVVTCSGGGPGTLVGPGAAGALVAGFQFCSSGSPGDGAVGGGASQLAQIGAGGGGLYGGGAGAGAQVLGTGGGGGSNLVGSGTATNGVRAGDGLITITYAEPPPPPPSADVAVSVTGPTSAKRGTQVAYVITVSNAGPNTAHNVVLTDPIPSGASFLGVSTSKGTCTPPKKGAPVRCALGDLVSGNNALSAVSVKITAAVGSTVANIVSAESTANGAGPATADPQGSNNSASLITTVTK